MTREKCAASTQGKKFPLVPIIFIAILTAVFALIIYDFWTKFIYPSLSILFTFILPSVSFALSLTEIPDNVLKKLHKKVDHSVWVFISGISLGILLSSLLYNAGVRVQTHFTHANPTQLTESTTPDEHTSEIELPPAPSMPIKDESQIPIGPNTDIDVVEPETAITQMVELQNSKALKLNYPPNRFLQVISSDLEGISTEHTGANKATWISLIGDAIKRQVHSEIDPPADTINGNKQFTDKTEKANIIQDEHPGLEEVSIVNCIRLREAAYQIIPAKSLRHLLASDYHRLAKVRCFQKDWDGAIDNYLMSIEYEIRYIRTLPEINDTYYEHLYNIAVLYQCIGDIPVMARQYKEESYFLSACFFELICKNVFDEENDEAGFFASYYAGMVNHKLFLLHWVTHEAESNYYIVDAMAYYKKSLEYENYRKQRGYQYSYLIQMCQHAQDYLRYYYKPPNMKTMDEYASDEVYYRDLAV